MGVRFVSCRTVVSGCCPRSARLHHVLVARDRSMTQGTLRVISSRPRLRLSTQFVRRTTVLRSVKVFRASTPNVRYFNSRPCVYRNQLNTRLLHGRKCRQRTQMYRHRANTNVAGRRVRGRRLPLPRRSFLPRAVRRGMVYCTSGFFDGARLSGRGDVRGTRGDLTGFNRRKMGHFRR